MIPIPISHSTIEYYAIGHNGRRITFGDLVTISIPDPDDAIWAVTDVCNEIHFTNGQCNTLVICLLSEYDMHPDLRYSETFIPAAHVSTLENPVHFIKTLPI